ncbi:RNHCP domain-containing protein [Streptomyces scopuliridis]
MVRDGVHPRPSEHHTRSRSHDVPQRFQTHFRALVRTQLRTRALRSTRRILPLSPLRSRRTDDRGRHSHRNHCPNCLWSRHVDDTPGDRAADCGARMEPLAISVRGDGEWVLVHRCVHCDVLHANRTAGDDNVLPLTRLAVRPLAQPPFPLERLGSL